ncbi:ATP-dependent Clp protease proteolytic subunit [Bacillus sp. 349Y]|nr:ATP-dependent Clp protease proteolytic subunit [Bacillus sp. 349Y]
MRMLKFKNEKYMEQLKKIPHNFAVSHDEEKKESTITIYGIIGDSWWDDSTSASDVDSALKSAGSNDLVVHLNSPGGDASDGIAIYNRLKNHAGKVTVYVDGWACSAASVIAMAADELIMGAGSMLMIHEASTIVWGTKKNFRKEADLLEKLEDGIIDIYMTKSKVDREDIKSKVDEETWFSANEAIEIGFATPSSTTTSTDDEENEEITQLKNQVKSMQNQLDEFKNNEQVPVNQKPWRFF